MYQIPPENHPFRLIKDEISKVWKAYTKDKSLMLIKARIYKLTYNGESIVVKLVAASSTFNIVYFDVIIENNNFPYMKPSISGMHACIRVTDFQVTDFTEPEQVQIEQI